jgi:hypothetical protein
VGVGGVYRLFRFSSEKCFKWFCFSSSLRVSIITGMLHAVVVGYAYLIRLLLIDLFPYFKRDNPFGNTHTHTHIERVYRFTYHHW